MTTSPPDGAAMIGWFRLRDAVLCDAERTIGLPNKEDAAGANHLQKSPPTPRI